MNERDINIRVRGIYATALTKLLLDHGFSVVQASDKIKHRFSGTTFTDKPANVTIKDTENKLGFVIIGDPEAVEKVYSCICEFTSNSIVFKSVVPLHAIIKGRVIEKPRERVYLVDLGNVKGELYTTQPLNMNDEVIVDVRKTQLRPPEKVILSFNYNIYGPNVVLIYNLPKIIISKHIRDPEIRKELLALASLYRMKNSKWGIKWRSSARFTPLSELMKELQTLYKRAEEVLSKAKEKPAYEIIEPGQAVIEILLSRIDKEKLDAIRQNVIPTVIGHHSLKSFGKKSSTVIDVIEYVIERVGAKSKEISKGLLEYIIDHLRELKEVKIYHVRAYDGKVFKLTPGRIVSVKEDNTLGKVIVLKRRIRGKGIYDGLGVPKEPGDHDEMVVPLDKWIIIHNYYSRRSELKGRYININTPVELSLSSIRYIDLSLDIIVDSNNNVRMVDVEEFKRMVKMNIIGDKVINILEEQLKAILGREISLHNIVTEPDAGVPEPGQRGRAQDLK